VTEKFCQRNRESRWLLKLKQHAAHERNIIAAQSKQSSVMASNQCKLALQLMAVAVASNG